MIERARRIPRPDEPEVDRVGDVPRGPIASDPTRAASAHAGRVDRRPDPLAPDIDRAIVQAKLTVGPVGDAFEREADEVAAKVVRSLQSHEPLPTPGPEADSTRVQRSSRVAVLDADGGGESGGDAGDGRNDGHNRDAEHLDVGGGRLIRRRPFRPVAATPVASTVRRIQRSERESTIGVDGGDLDPGTSRLLQRSRAGGSPLPDVARAPMESAFGADFSGVRVHTGPTSTELNDRIQAKAFTTGRDIFFRDGLPDVGSTSGQELLAHELTHTLQQGASLQRSSVVMRRWWPFGKKKGASKPEIGAPTNASLNGGDVDTELAKQGFHPVALENPLIGQDEVQTRPRAGYSGQAGKAPSSAAVEAGKPGAAVSVAAGAGATAALVKGGDAATGGLSGIADVALAGGVGGGLLGLATAGDAVAGLNSARNMSNEAERFDDAGMAKMASSKAKDQGTQLAVGLGNTAKGATVIADVYSGSTQAVAAGTAPVAATAAAAGGLGIATGSVMVLQGSWRGGKAIMKLCRLTYGRAQTMLSPDGERWKKVFVSSEKWKVAVNAFKIVAGGLGVAAGALVIVGSPVGWILGLSAAIAAGIYAGAKVAGKVSNARAKSKARAADAAKSEISAPMGASQLQQVGDGYHQGYVDLPSMGYDMSKVRQAGPQNEPDRGTGMSNNEHGPQDDETAQREAAIAEADRLAAQASKNAQIAAEVREALGRGDGEFIDAAMQAAQSNPNAALAEMITNPDDQRLHDAFVLLSSVNIDPDEALSASGQLLIEQKLSTAEAM